MNNFTRTTVNLNGKDYTVHSRIDASGRIEWSIFIEYEAFDLARRNLCRQSPVWRIRHVEPDGRLGRAILRRLESTKGATP